MALTYVTAEVPKISYSTDYLGKLSLCARGPSNAIAAASERDLPLLNQPCPHPSDELTCHRSRGAAQPTILLLQLLLAAVQSAFRLQTQFAMRGEEFKPSETCFSAAVVWGNEIPKSASVHATNGRYAAGFDSY
ncbi:hypothetical protein CEXT_377311 [Caerostris extrusa]|uniref:Uncharacterized protein n=1 Tax=Caerostris extrusa TaxID=172846 RepID=A0AAV4MPI3_CAEEX|nr:hypothetical protein CEXT_377311 [Caerostris extrusa]